MSFNNSSQVVIHGHAINNVEGNQINTSQTITAEVVNINSQMEKERTEYDEFEEVKRGQIFTLERIHTEDLSSERRAWEIKDGRLVRKPSRLAQQTVCTVKVYPDQQNKYTAVIYEGQDAPLVWKEDFERFSCAGLGKPEAWQLYGLNRSKIPLLIFHGEFVPLANFYKDSFWGNFYLGILSLNLKCVPSKIWLNMGGNLCKGFEGPRVPCPLGSFFDIVVPCSAEMLQDDICFKFFRQSSSSQLDRTILSHAYWRYRCTFLDNLFNHHLPSASHHALSHWTVEEYCTMSFRNLPHHFTLDMFDGLRFNTVCSPSRGAVARWPRGAGEARVPWDVFFHQGLVNQTNVGDGIIRFELDDPRDVEISIQYGWMDFQESWLAQSSRIMDAHEMSGMEEECFVVNPPPLCFSSHKYDRKPSLTVENPPPIYLFIYPPPLSMAELISWENGHTQSHFWSLDENGRSEMSEEECRRWGIPELQVKLDCTGMDLRYRPTHIYTALHKWQVACGFDPTTADWAQSLGYPELEIIGGKEEEARFEGVQDDISYLRKLGEQYVDLQLGPPVQVQETASIIELPLATPTREPSPIPVSNLISGHGRKRRLTPEDSQVGHNDHSGERPKRRRKKRALKKPITTPSTNK